MARRSSPPPGEYDLDAILGDGERRKSPRPSARTAVLLVVATILAVAMVSSAVARLMGQEEHPNLAPDLGLGSALSELHDVDGDWIGIAAPGWAGALDPAEAARRCTELARTASVPAGEVLSLMTVGGQPLASCEAGGGR